MEEEEKTILERLHKGDPDALHTIYLLYSAKVRSFAFRLLGNDADAEDLTHDVFLKIWENRRALSEIRSFQNYLFTMTRNSVFNTVKRRTIHRKWKDSQGNAPEHWDDEYISTNDLLRLIDLEVSRMPDQRRTVFHLNRYEKMSYNEIAELLGISPKTVQYHISKALADLRTLLDNDS